MRAATRNGSALRLRCHGPGCGRVVNARRRDARYCSDACRQRAYRRRLRRPGLFSSTTDEWETPAELFATLDAEFRFDLDVCADAGNAKCARYFTREDDGLAQEWAGACWMNPPYGREIGRWMAKARDSAAAGAVVVCLVPARTDTRWWHDHAAHGEVRYLRGRLKFGGASAGAPFPSAVVVFRSGGAS